MIINPLREGVTKAQEDEEIKRLLCLYWLHRFSLFNASKAH